MVMLEDQSRRRKIDKCYLCIERRTNIRTGSLLNDIIGSTYEEKQAEMYKNCCEIRASGRCNLTEIEQVKSQAELADRFCMGVMNSLHRV